MKVIARSIGIETEGQVRLRKNIEWIGRGRRTNDRAGARYSASLVLRGPLCPRRNNFFVPLMEQHI
jgi:hypothetical protein